MLENDFDYNKTVETNRLVFKGQKYQIVVSYIFQFIIVITGLGISFSILKSQLANKPSLPDYLVALFFPILIMTLCICLCRMFLTRDELKEIETSLDKNLARIKLLEAAKTLNWRPDVISEKYMIFVTKFNFIDDCQTITLVIFPDGRIFFNSISHPNDYIQRSRFRENYNDLVSAFLRIEKE